MALAPGGRSFGGVLMLFGLVGLVAFAAVLLVVISMHRRRMAAHEVLRLRRAELFKQRFQEDSPLQAEYHIVEIKIHSAGQ